MKAKKVFVSLTVLLMLLPSCTWGVKENRDQPADNKWLQSLVCQFPCWENIIPQKTIYEDAFSILRQASIEASFANEREISFHSQDNIYGSVSKATDGTVNTIILFVDQQKLRIEDVLQILGSPGKIALVQIPFDSAHCEADIVFPNHGTILELYLEDNGLENTCGIEVNADSQVYRVLLLGNIDESEFWKYYANLDFMEWKGYGEYP